MISKKITFFIESLIDKTNENRIEWKPFYSCLEKKKIIEELNKVDVGVDFGVNSIRERGSYFFESNGGYIFLFEIFHGDPEVTSPEMDTLSLMIKIDSKTKLYNLSEYTLEEQEKLEELKLIVENYLENKNTEHEKLDDFIDHIIES